MIGARRKRLRAVVGQVAGQRLGNGAPSEARRREAIQAKLKEAERRAASRSAFDLGRAIAQAGLQVSRQRFITAAIACGALLGFAGLALSPFAGILAFIVGLLGLPRLFLKIAAQRRLARFISRFAEALDIIIRGVRSGLPLGESLNVIGREMPDPIGVEFRMVTEGIRLGMTMEESLDRLSERVPTAEVRFFAIVVGIQQQTGGNLAETLAKLSDVLRARKRMRDKIQAMSSEAKASAIIIGSLPLAVSGILGVIAPEYIVLLFTTGPGNLILFTSAVVMGIGTMVMRAMINFEI
jgi:tight adherence protein B